VTLEFAVFSSRLDVRVRDEGQGFDPIAFRIRSPQKAAPDPAAAGV
jgi:hypothetical protein